MGILGSGFLVGFLRLFLVWGMGCHLLRLGILLALDVEEVLAWDWV